MKKVMFALCLMIGGTVAVTAQDTQDTTSNQYRTETQSQYPEDQSSQDPSSQEQPGQEQSNSYGLNQDRERIQSTELPDGVKRSLEGQEYRGWLISGAFKAKASADSAGAGNDMGRQESANATATGQEEMFIVELKNGAETKTVYFNGNGEQVEGMADGGNQESQFNQNNQFNQNERMETTPGQAEENDPNATEGTSDGAQSSGDKSEQSTGTETETSENDDASTETPTDQSKANEPK